MYQQRQQHWTEKNRVVVPCKDARHCEIFVRRGGRLVYIASVPSRALERKKAS